MPKEFFKIKLICINKQINKVMKLWTARKILQLRPNTFAKICKTKLCGKGMSPPPGNSEIFPYWPYCGNVLKPRSILCSHLRYSPGHSYGRCGFHRGCGHFIRCNRSHRCSRYNHSNRCCLCCCISNSSFGLVHCFTICTRELSRW